MVRFTEITRFLKQSDLLPQVQTPRQGEKKKKLMRIAVDLIPNNNYDLYLSGSFVFLDDNVL